MTEISALVTSTWNLIQHYLPIISTKSFEKYKDSAVAQIWSSVEERFSKDTSTKEVLSDLIKKTRR
jgi:hypothetical protein